MVAENIMADDEDDRDRDERGRYREQFTDDDVVAFLRDAPEPAQTARSVADEFDVERQSADGRLRRLHDEGRVERAALSPRVVIWWVDDGERPDGGSPGR